MLKRIIALSLGVLALQIACPVHGAIATWEFDPGDRTAPTYDADAGSVTGSYITIQGGTPSFVSGGNPGDALQLPNSTTMKIQFVGTGFYGFILQYDAMLATGSSAAQVWSYSYTGSSGFTPVPVQPANLTTEWTTYTLDLSGIAALNDKAQVVFKYSNGTLNAINFDNIQIIPEPANVALAVFGLCGVGMFVGRRVYGWMKS